MAFSNSKDRCVTLTSSEDEEKEECIPRIIDTVSLQGCSSAFSFNERSEENMSILYPQCEISEETLPVGQKIEKINEEKNVHIGKKRGKLIHLTSKLQNNEPKASHSRHNEEDIVDANKLELQENVFKTKEKFDTFLRVCQDLDNSPEMQKVVEKLERAYGQARQEYLGSPKFQSILESETEKVNTSNTKPWLNLKLVLDELKYNKKSSPSKLKLGESEESQDGKRSDEEPVIECAKKRRHLKKLEKTLRALNLKIKKLEEKEVDLDDEDSSYIKLDRYRAQFTKIYNKVCEIRGKLADADRPYLRKVSFAGTTYPHINRCIERYYNKHRTFPDFQDIKKLVILALKQENIDMQPIKIHEMAAKAFKDFGEMLKRLRQYDDYDIIISYLEHQIDPARDNEELQEKLNMNALLFKKKEQEVIDKFAAQDAAGIHTGSGEGSESRPKKKRKLSMKIQKPSTSRKLPSSSESTDDESSEQEEDKRESVQRKTPGVLLESSDDSSDEEDKKVKDKGKSLVGKKRFVKRGSKLNTQPKPPQPKTTISSDDENNPKDTFTNYLGLHSTPKKDEDKVVKSEDESDDEIILIQNIKKKSSEKRTVKRKESYSSYSSETDVEKDKMNTMELDNETTNCSNKINGSTNLQEDDGNDSDSDQSSKILSSSPKLIKENVEEDKKRETFKTDKKTNRINGLGSHPVLDQRTRISLSSDSDNESAERTSADESEFSAKRSVSDKSKAQSSDDNSEHSDEENKETSDVDSPIVILSEDVMEDTVKTQLKKIPEESDSDNDICVLSQSSTETRTVAPRRTKQGVVNSNQFRPVTNVKRSSFATSTPVQKPSGFGLKRRGSNHIVNGVSKRPRRTSSESRQMTLPQVINGASRKTLNHCKPASSPDTIPLIELD